MSEYINRQHQRVGHVFQGRFKAILVQKDSYFLELVHYIVLNPVRAHMVHNAKQWRWSSYRSTAGYDERAACLTTELVLAGFADTKNVAEQRYRDFIQAGKGQPSPWQQLTRNGVELKYIMHSFFAKKMAIFAKLCHK